MEPNHCLEIDHGIKKKDKKEKRIEKSIGIKMQRTKK